jgi:ribosomal protein L21
VLERRITGRYDVQPQPIFAVVEVGGTQHKVTADDLVITERLEGVDVNDVISLQRVLLVGTPGETLIGRPYVPGATVTAAVEVRPPSGRSACTRWRAALCLPRTAARSPLGPEVGYMRPRLAAAGAISRRQGAHLPQAAQEELEAPPRPPPGAPRPRLPALSPCPAGTPMPSWHPRAPRGAIARGWRSEQGRNVCVCASPLQPLTTLRILSVMGLEAGGAAGGGAP